MAEQTFQLVMQMGPNPGKTFELDQKEISVGRDVSNHIVINDPEISRKHARLALQAGGYFIEDLGSTNGTFIDGQRLMGPHSLRYGETIMFGDKVSLTYKTISFDPDATLISTSGAEPIPAEPLETYRFPPQQEGYYAPPPAQEVYTPHTPQTAATPSYQSYEPAYDGQAPRVPADDYFSQPAEPYQEPYLEAYDVPIDGEKKSRTWLYVGCGCLILFLFCVAASAFVFDYMNLYCEPPFDTIKIFNC